MAKPVPSIPTTPAQFDSVRLQWRTPTQAPAIRLPAGLKAINTAADLNTVLLRRKAPSQAPVSKGFAVPKTPAEFEKILSRRKAPSQTSNVTRIPK